MLGVGIGYIFIGLVPFITKKLKGHLKEEVAKTYKGFLYCGIAILILYGIGFLLSLDNVYQTTLAVLPVLVFVPSIMFYIKKTFDI